MRNLPRQELYNEQFREQRKHYIKWSERFRIAKTISLLAFISVILIAFAFFGDSITYENLQLLLKNIDSEYYSSDVSQGVIYYNSDENTVFEEFDGNLIIAGNHGVSLYSMPGRKIFSYNDSFKAPRISVSDKYFIVYELNGNKFSVYSKIGLIFQDSEYEYPISSVFVSDNGKFLVATKSRENSTCVYLYNEKFSIIGKYENSRHLFSCAISNDGKYVALATAEAENGIFKTVTTLYKVSTAEQIFKIENNNTFPLKVFFSKKNSVILCCSDETFIYNMDAVLNASYKYDSELLTNISFNGDNSIAFVFSSDNTINKSCVNILDIKGKVRYNGTDIERVDDVSFFGDSLFVLNDNKVSKITQKGVVVDREFEKNTLIHRIFAFDENSVIVVGNEYSFIIDFNN